MGKTKEIKVRKQYFGLILFMVCVSMILSLIVFVVSSFQNSVTYEQMITDAREVYLFCMLIIVPLYILNHMNRYCFGKVVCSIDDRGIHFNHRIIMWDDIESATHEIGSRTESCCMCIISRGQKFKLIHAPYYLAGIIKKKSPDAIVKMSRSSKQVVISSLILVIVVLVIII